MVIAAMKLKDTRSLEVKLYKPTQHIKKQIHHFADKSPNSQSYGFSSSHVWMWELEHKEGWALKTLKSPLDSKEIKPVNPKGTQNWIFIWRTEAEAPILWPPNAKNWIIGNDSDAGKDWWQDAKGMTEDEMVGCHHQFNGHEFEQTPEIVKDREDWHASVHGSQRVGHIWATKQSLHHSFLIVLTSWLPE